MSAHINVEVVFALPESQSLTSVKLPEGSKAMDAIEKSGIADRFSDIDIRNLPIGIWGRVVSRDHILRNGDRVEIYRALDMDPREARRQLAQAGKTMGRAGD